MKQLILIIILQTVIVFKFFKFKAKVSENTVAQLAPNEANGILRNATIAVPLTYLNDF